MKIGIVGDEDTMAMFKFAGVAKCYGFEEIEKALNDDELAILIITHEYAKKLKEKIFYHRLQKDLPIIVEIPSKHKEVVEDTIKKVIVRAVGVEID